MDREETPPSSTGWEKWPFIHGNGDDHWECGIGMRSAVAGKLRPRQNSKSGAGHLIQHGRDGGRDGKDGLEEACGWAAAGADVDARVKLMAPR
jgi:hypothetical protein